MQYSYESLLWKARKFVQEQRKHAKHGDDFLTYAANCRFMEKCVKLMNAPDVVIQSTETHFDEIGAMSKEAQIRLREAYPHIVYANAGMGYVILDDDTIRCISSSQYVAQFDGCKYWEITVYIDR